MKIWRKSFTITLTSYSLTCFLLGGFMCCCLSGAQVTFVKPPENITVCNGSSVNISCGYQSNTTLNVGWRIGNTRYFSDSSLSSKMYRVNNQSGPLGYSLTVRYIYQNTTFRCIVGSNNTFSTPGTVTILDNPVLHIVTLTVGCGYVYISWATDDDENLCSLKIKTFIVEYSAYRNGYSIATDDKFLNYSLPGDTPFNVSVYGIGPSNIGGERYAVTTIDYAYIRTEPIYEPAPIMVKANVNFDTFVITLSWQVPNCTRNINITMYNITVMDQYSPANVTVPANVSSVEISQFPYNGTSIVANREYTITVSAISDQGTSYPSDRVVVDTFVLQNCTATSPTIGTIRTSCDSSSHQILIALRCANNCTNPVLLTFGSSPLIVKGLDPGITYSVIIYVFDGSQVVLRHQRVTRKITVMGGNGGGTGSNCRSGDNNATVTAVVGGAVAAILIFAIVVICCCVVRKKKDSSYHDDDKGSLQREPMLQSSKYY